MNGYEEAALANIRECIESLRAATRARTESGRATLTSRALGQAINASEKLADAIAEARREVA